VHRKFIFQAAPDFETRSLCGEKLTDGKQKVFLCHRQCSKYSFSTTLLSESDEKVYPCGIEG
jgi:hypothetical protein